MFVRALGLGWASLVTVPVPATDPETGEWLAGLTDANPDETLAAVVAAPTERVVAAVITLLARAHQELVSGSDPVPALDGVGPLLLRVVARGARQRVPRRGAGRGSRAFPDRDAEFTEFRRTASPSHGRRHDRCRARICR